LGQANYGPAQVVGSGSAPIFFWKKKQKKSKKTSKIIFKKIAIFSNIFLSILHNIGLYIYTVKYKFGIKIPGFLQNISKQIRKIS